MIEPLLQKQLRPVVRRHRSLTIYSRLAVCWAALGLGIWVWHALGLPGSGWSFAAVVGALAAGATLLVCLAAQKTGPDYREVARRIEQQHPELHSLLLTAVEQSPDRDGGELNYLQQRVVREATIEALSSKWTDSVPPAQFAFARVAHWAALVWFALALLYSTPASREYGVHSPAVAGVTVTPGDATIERGSALVVLVKFPGKPPREATLVINSAGETNQNIALIKNLDDPVFGGSIAEVKEDLDYRIEYTSGRTKDFKVRVFDYPRLERADAHLKFPEYTGKAAADVKDTRRVSAVEGSHLDWSLHLNKPVASARLVAKDKTVLELLVETNKAFAALTNQMLDKTRTYHLVLTDHQGRTNKVPAQFVVEVLTNRQPEIKLATPKGDQRLSPLEEISFQAETWDDFGLSAYGLAFTVTGKETSFIELGKTTAANEKRGLNHIVKLEDLSAKADQLVSWYLWADDVGPDGAVRRTSSDMFFAELRPFEEIFRDGQGMDGGGEMQQQGGAGSESLKLADLQKEIINATWKLHRRENANRSNTPSSQYVKDANVMLESQKQALDQAQGLRLKALDPRMQGLWELVENEMNEAVEHLTEATNSPSALSRALTSEQAAYQALLKIAGREYMVMRNSRSRSGGGGGGGQRNQRQLEQLEFKNEDNRYETQREASPMQSAEQREQMGVLNRLKELAQRQQDLNERLKELQTALQEAKTAEEKEELRRQLKRLREEEQQLLADTDEVLQRMAQPQNQSRMAEAREQLEKTRSEVQRAAESLAKESVADALTSGTRAERDLEQLRDDFRKNNSSQFAEQMRQMRSDARELARNQEEVGQKLGELAEPKRKSLSDSEETKELAETLTNQKNALTNLMENMRQTSEQAEAAEPLLSRQLYDTLRKAAQDDANRAKEVTADLLESGTLSRSLYERLRELEKSPDNKSLEITAELLRNNLVPQAVQSEQRVRTDIEQLKRGVEKAAESVLGDDLEALRLAQSELNELSNQLEKEMAQRQGGGGTNGPVERAVAGEEQPGATNALARSTQPSDRSDSSYSRGSSNQTAQAQSGQPSGQSDGSQQQADSQAQSGQANNSDRSAAVPGRSNGQTADAPPSQQSGSQPSGQSENASASANRNDGRGGNQRETARNLLERFANERGGDGGGGGGPLTGEDYFNWSERLGNVEEMIEDPELRQEIVRVRDRARAMRTEFKRHARSPEWPLVKAQILDPLTEVRSRVSEEIARRQSTEALVPIDRDPVPTRFSELVRKYYEKLGSAE